MHKVFSIISNSQMQGIKMKGIAVMHDPKM